MKRYLLALLLLPTLAHATTYYVRSDGGSRYSTDLPYGSCNGHADTAYPGLTSTLWWPAITYSSTGARIVDANGNYEQVTAAGSTALVPPTWPAHGSSGTTTVDGDVTWTSGGAAPINQDCAFNDVRWTWMTGGYGNSAWITSGGDTVVVRSCVASPIQQNPDANPAHCRIGTDKNNGPVFNGTIYNWCAGVSTPYGCSIPPPPAGSSPAHTKILSGCAFDGTCNPVTSYPYTSNNLTQLFGGFNLGAVLYLNSTQYIDVKGFEVTEHNGACTTIGSPAYPAGCATSSPVSDFARYGITFDQTSANIALTDVYVHGMTNLGLGGPIGGAITFTRTSVDFNAFAGWNMDDGVPTPDAPGSTITQSYMTMIGNGCLEQYPIVNPSFPAKACWDSLSGGFGDAWSGQNTNLASFTCDHCFIAYNAKDGALGPHTVTHNISLTNSVWAANMGQAGKWGQDTNSTFLFQNNLLLGNCMRMTAAVPGAAQNFNLSSGLPGSYLSNFCRAAGPLFDYFAGPGSTVNFTANTIVTYQPTIFEPGCAPMGSCGSTAYNFTDNLILAYTSTYTNSPFTAGQNPTLFAFDDSPLDIQWSHNLTFGTRNGDYTVNCAASGNVCANPLLTSQPTGAIPPETTLDSFASTAGTSWYPGGGSPALGAGVAVGGLTADYYGNARANPPTIGAVEVAGTPTVATPTFSPIAGTYVGTQTVTISTVTGGASLIYTTDGSTPTVTTLTCTITHGTLYSTPLTVSANQTLKALGCLSGDNASAVATAAYVINGAATPTFSPVAGSYVGTQSVTLATATTACTSSLVWNTTNAQTGGNLTGTSVTNPLSVAASETVYAQVQGCSGVANSAIGSAAYTISAPTAPQFTITGTATFTNGTIP